MGIYYTNYIKIEVQENLDTNLEYWEVERFYQNQKKRMVKVFENIFLTYMKLEDSAYPLIAVDDIKKYLSENLKSHYDSNYTNQSVYYIDFTFKYGDMEFYKEKLVEELEENLSLHIFSMEMNNSEELSGLWECRKTTYELRDKIKELENKLGEVA